MSIRQLFIAKALWLMCGISLLWCIIVYFAFTPVPLADVDILDGIGEASTIVMAGIFSTFIAKSNMHESTKVRLVAAMLCMFIGGSADFIDEFFVVRYWPALLENSFKTAAALFTLWGMLSLTREAKSSERRADHFRKVSNHLGILTQIGQKITRTEKLKDILEIVHSNILELATVELFRAMILTDGKLTQKLVRQPSGSKKLNKSAIKALELMEQWVVNNQTSLYLFDLSRCAEHYLEPEQQQELLHLMANDSQLQNGSVFIVPVELEQGVIGVFTLFMARKQGLDSEQCHSIESIAAYSAVAISNALRSEELTRKVSES